MAAFHFLLKNGIPMIFFCDVLAYTTYNHTYFLRRKKAIRRKDVPMNIKKTRADGNGKNNIRLPAPETRYFNNITNCSQQDKDRQNDYDKLGKYKLLHRG